MFAAPAVADTIRITAGSAEVTGTGASASTPIPLEGERGFTLDSLAPGSPSDLVCADQCVPGARVSLSMGWGGFDLPARVTLDGVTYEGVGSAASRPTPRPGSLHQRRCRRFRETRRRWPPRFSSAERSQEACRASISSAPAR